LLISICLIDNIVVCIFAQSLQMPGEHRELYVSTTLSIIIFTTVVCGGLTESLLTKMGMKVNSKELDEKNKDTSLALSEVL
jgi:sodium/hydrogen exchanger 8